MGVICLLDMAFLDLKVEVLSIVLVLLHVNLFSFVVAMLAFKSSKAETEYNLSFYLSSSSAGLDLSSLEPASASDLLLLP
jgi:hypothetical protein